MRIPSPLRVPLLVAVAVGCNTITEEMPQRPSPINIAPVPVVVVPVPIPSPANPGPTTPPSGPTPAPGNPTPPPQGAACSLPAGTGSGNNCPKPGPSFLGEVDAAINLLVQQRPSLFDLRDVRGDGGYRVKDVRQFQEGVATNLRGMGLCAIADGGDELAVKNSNSSNDQYDIVLSSGHIFRGPGSYAATCFPAWF
ncbi:MAG TPA: hypothetical protein VJU18_17045 [Vicinamibacteria bacterium]|nr:hypothetical protein [Vicinamibacteria bacterium]